MGTYIKYIDYYLPENIFSNSDLSIKNPDWPMEKIAEKTGINARHRSLADEFSVDMGICASRKLINENNINVNDIDFILFCTQTPKFLIPSNACLIHEALGLRLDVGALDINQGCSGYVYALMLADTMITQGRANNILLVTADTYSKLIAQDNRALVPLFGDGASASLISKRESKGIEHFEFGTNGAGAEKLIAQKTGVLGLMSNELYKPDLYMNGSAIFNFTLEIIPELVKKLLTNSRIEKDSIDHFIFHQANAYMLEHLREKIDINKDKFRIHLADVGNTVSSSIPIVISESIKNATIKTGDKIVLVGFGVGLSWAACVLSF